MAKRDNHYEAAFEAWLRERRAPYVAVDETKRSLLGADESLKSLDFVVSPPDRDTSWLIDVKGRRFPSGRRKQYWKNWSTRDELASLARWETLFGPRFSALLVFAYLITDDRSPVAPHELFAFRNQLYGFVGIRLDHYAAGARTLSPRWDTVTIPVARFRALAVECGALFDGATRPRPLAAGA